MTNIKKILGLGIIGAVVGAIIGWVVQTFEPIGGVTVGESVVTMALAGAIAVNVIAWITMNDRW